MFFCFFFWNAVSFAVFPELIFATVLVQINAFHLLSKSQIYNNGDYASCAVSVFFFFFISSAFKSFCHHHSSLFCRVSLLHPHQMLGILFLLEIKLRKNHTANVARRALPIAQRSFWRRFLNTLLLPVFPPPLPPPPPRPPPPPSLRIIRPVRISFPEWKSRFPTSFVPDDLQSRPSRAKF